MPTTDPGLRETDIKKLPMELVRSVSYGIGKMLVEEQDESLTKTIQSFLGAYLTDRLSWNFEPLHRGDEHLIRVSCSKDVGDDSIYEEGYTNSISDSGDPDLSGALIVRDMILAIKVTSERLHTKLTFKQYDDFNKVEDAAYLLSMVPV